MQSAFRVASMMLLAVVCALVPACKKGGERVLRVGYFANLSHAQAVLAVSSGELQKRLGATKLETKVFNAGPSLMEALLAGEIDVGYVGPGPAINAHHRTKGKGLRVIAGASANGVVIVARQGSGIKDMRDLKDKRVATPQLGNTQDIAARRWVREVLGRANADNVVPVANAEQAALFTRGDVDAAWVPEPWGQKLVADTGAMIVAEEKDVWPSKEFTLAVVVASPEALASRKEDVDALLEVHRSWTKRLQENPQSQVGPIGDALAKLTAKRIPDAVLAPAIARVKFTDEPLEDTLKTMAKWTHDLGFEREAGGIDGLVAKAGAR